MKLKCTINGKEYTNIVQGVSFADEFNETLDSGAIIISDVPELDIKPYDDVYIYENEFVGYPLNGCYYKIIDAQLNVKSTLDSTGNSYEKEIAIGREIIEAFKEPHRISYEADVWYVVNNRKIKEKYRISFNDDETVLQFGDEEKGFNLYYNELYKQFKNTIEKIGKNIVEIQILFTYKYDGIKQNGFYKHLLIDNFQRETLNLSEGIYKYKINLFSETKRLETIPLPNISITQPLNFKKKKTVWFYLKKYIDLYSPLVKVSTDSKNKKWIYAKKFRLDENLKEIFDKVYSPDFSLNDPNLRDVISKLMLTKDYIPVLKDNVITGIKISESKGDFDDKNINFLMGTLSSQNYCNNLKRTYSNALSENSSCHSIEYLSFRNSSTALLTLENMRLETRFPIYKINNILMCYYKKVSVKNKIDGQTYDRMFLCKTDITPLVKLNSERNLLSQDWEQHSGTPNNVEEMSKLKFCTVGYDIGSKYISGWGTKYETLLPYDYLAWFKNEKTYVENIVSYLHSLYPMGIYTFDYLFKENENSDNFEIDTLSFGGEGDEEDELDFIISPFEESSDSLKLKSLFFIIDYEGFYNGTMIHSKDVFDDDITIVDNSSESLTLLEQDGVYQKEKIERYGNEIFRIPARYETIDELQEVGTVYKDNIIIYHREYSIYDNCINAVYYGAKDYILKNFYTTVYAKHRNYNLMSYEESVKRSENKKKFLFLSKEKYFYENDEKIFNEFIFSNNDGIPLYEKLLSFCKDSGTIKFTNKFVFPQKINYAFIKNAKNNKAYLSDINTFVSGNSLCFNLKMYDNVSGGVYIAKKQPEINQNVEEDYIGSFQNWYLIVDDVETGKIDKIEAFVCHVDDNYFLNEKTVDYDKNLIVNDAYKKIFALPEIDISKNDQKINNLIGGEMEVFKDNKEELDLTFQYEIFTENKDIFITPWVFKLSDLLSTYFKVDIPKKTINKTIFSSNFESYYGVDIRGLVFGVPIIYLKIKKNEYDKLSEGDLIQGAFDYTNEIDPFLINDPTNMTVARQMKIFFSEINKKTELSSGKKVMQIRSNIELKTASVEFVNLNPFGQFFDRKTEYAISDLTFVSTDKWKWYNYNDSEWGEEKLDDEYYHFFNGEFGEVSIGGVMPGVSFLTYGTSGDNVTLNYDFPKFYGGYMTALTSKDDIRIEDTVTMEKFCQEKNRVTVAAAPSGNTFIYEKNIFVKYSSELLVNERFRDETNNFEKNDISVSKNFEFYKDKKGRDCFKINLYDMPEDAKSIQFWFYNEKSNSYHFVMGANINDKEKEKKEIVIYCSLLSRKDLRVYDKDSKLVGEVVDFSEDDEKVANGQYYKIKEGQ